MTITPSAYAKHASDAFNRRDLEALLALVSDDFIYVDSMGMQIGREAMRKRETALLEAFPDAHLTLTPFLVSDNRLALTASLAGTFAAPLVLPDRVIPSHGGHIAVHYAAHFTFRNGLVVSEEAFFDSAVLMPLAEQGEC
ncbi:ester cyclase [Pseudomonas sichuanensis]|uniref:ester cyclase n=1 Tax=Pseudomonas sichuanensis TaxID=2213015 RepID=UPI003801BB4B